ncbi:APC amino acid permease [Coprinopsis sp. MPI-PUGE-AT-0042]|nr:APC amino acid permease [Coprinopsis sp. MPI-PUGE-AT-0042]
MPSRDRDPEVLKRREAIKQADIHLLARLGYKQEFNRAFKPLEVFGVAFSIIGLVPSIANCLLYSIPQGGGPAMVWGWMVASIGILCVGLSMAELASAAPTSGGLYYWSYSLSSPAWRELTCWIVGYANSIGTVASVASINWGCATQIMTAITIGTDGVFEATNPQVFGAFAACIVTQALLGCLGTRILARLQIVYIIFNIVLCMVVLIILPVTTPEQFRNTHTFALFEFKNLTGWPNGFAFILSFLTPLWTICSFDSTIHISEETTNASVSVPWGLVNSIAVTGLLGWAINVVLAFCMGTDLEALVSSPQPLAVIFLQSFGKTGTLIIWSVVVIVNYMMGSSMLLAASRQIFAFSRDQALPFSKWLYQINLYTLTPIHTVWYCAFLAICVGLLSFAGPLAISAAFASAVGGQYVAYSIPIAARYLGKNNFEPGPFSLGPLSAPCAFISVAFMTFMIVVFLFPLTPGVTLGNMNYTVVVLFGVLILSLIWYYFPVYGGVNWFKGPVRTVSDEFQMHNHEIKKGDSPQEYHVNITEPSPSFYPWKAPQY